MKDNPQLFLEAAHKLKELTEAGEVYWKREPTIYRRNVWYAAYFKVPVDESAGEQIDESEWKLLAFDARFHYYIPSKSLDGEINRGRVETSFYLPEYRTQGYAAGSEGFYLIDAFVSSIFEKEKRQFENEKIATKRICHALAQESFYPTDETSLFDVDLKLIRFLLEGTRRGRIEWRKKGMRDRSRYFVTKIRNGLGEEFEIGIKSLRQYMVDDWGWRRVETPFILVLEIPGRKIPFVMSSEGYCLLEEILAAAKSRTAPYESLKNALRRVEKYCDNDDSPLGDFENLSYYELLERLLGQLWKLSVADVVRWEAVEGGQRYAGYLPGKCPFRKRPFEIERLWLASINQPGNDPLVLKITIFGHS